MEIISLCPFAVGTVIWQAQGGAFTLTTCVKGTFKLAHGRDALLAEDQEPIGGDRYYAGNAGGLYAPTDIAPYKPRSDVLLVGHAYAPGGKPVDALVARFTVGDLTKAIGIIGDRLWTEGPYGLEPSTPSPFTRMPLRYERAARGPGNPIGVDLAAPPLSGARALPNLEAVDDEAGSDLTVGFGPIPPAWGPRKNLLHAGAIAWVTDGSRGTVPDGFDFGFYNAAPRDQQVDLLRHSAKIVLENLHPEHARLETRLPNIRPKAFLIDRLTRRGNEIALRCDTIWIDTDRGIAVVTWRGLTGVETGDARALGTIAVAAEMKGKELRWKHVERLLAEEGLTSADTESFTMSDVNPLNVRYDGVMLGEVPAATAELPVPSVAGAFAAGLSSPAMGLPGSGLPGVDAPDESVETTTQRISVVDVRAKVEALTGAARPRSPSGSYEIASETTHTEVPTVQMRNARVRQSSAPDRAEKPAPNDGDSDGPEVDTVQVALQRPIANAPAARAPVPVARPQAPKVTAPPAPRAPSAPRPIPAAPSPPAILRPSAPATPISTPPPTAPPPSPRPGPTQPPLVAPISQAPSSPRPGPTQPPFAAPISQAPLSSRATPPQPPAIIPRESRPPPEVAMPPQPPAMIPARPPPEPATSPPPPAMIPSRPSLEPPAPVRVVGIADYARIEVALERGETSRILARLKLNPAELERVRAEWIDRIKTQPALQTELDEAMEAARWE